MTIELKEGLILTVDQVKNGSFTFKGKEVKLEQDENNPLVFSGKTELTKEQEEAGNLNVGFTYNAGTATGVVKSGIIVPDHDDFKDLNDAERITKLNSIEYQFGAEPTDQGQQLDHVLQNSVDTTSSQDKQQQGQTPKAKKEKETAGAAPCAEDKPATSTTTSSASKNTGVKIQDKPFPGQTGKEQY